MSHIVVMRGLAIPLERGIQSPPPNVFTPQKGHIMLDFELTPEQRCKIARLVERVFIPDCTYIAGWNRPDWLSDDADDFQQPLDGDIVEKYGIVLVTPFGSISIKLTDEQLIDIFEQMSKVQDESNKEIIEIRNFLYTIDPEETDEDH
jgi:hypothetical protein